MVVCVLSYSTVMEVILLIICKVSIAVICQKHTHTYIHTCRLFFQRILLSYDATVEPCDSVCVRAGMCTYDGACIIYNICDGALEELSKRVYRAFFLPMSESLYDFTLVMWVVCVGHHNSKWASTVFVRL